MDEPLRVPGYDVLEPVGQGASATVWRARRHADGLTVALKVIRPARGDVAEALREAGLLARLRHAHVIHLYDVMPLPDPVTGRPAAVVMATQFASGGSLAQVLTRRRMLSPGELVTVLQPVAGALAHLHGRGVVHGDLSSGNILFLGDGMPMLADLGASRVSGEAGRAAQGTGAQTGLVAPEVVEGFVPARESDVYQLGAVAWLCLVGAPPGPGFARADLDQVAPGLPAGLGELIRAALAPEPEDRPDAEEFALGLMAAAVPEPVEVAPDAEPGHGLTERLRQQARADAESEGSHLLAQPGAHRPARVGEARRSANLHRSVLILSVLAALTLVGGVATWLLSPGLLPWAGAGAHDQQIATPASPAPLTTEDVGDAASTQARTQIAGDSDSTEDSAEDVGGDAQRSVPRAAGPGATDAQMSRTLQRLVDLRGEAWEGRDPAALSLVMAPDSPALASEQGQLEAARALGLAYPDVTFRVEDAVVVEQADGRLTLEATITRAPLRAIDDDGDERLTSGMQTDQLRIVLAAAEEGWLLWSWGEPGG